MFEFRDLSAAPDEVHALFRQWARTRALTPPLTPSAFEVFKLAVHEWVANLVQHATFAEAPRIRLVVHPGERGGGERGVRCIIEDNSAGFDLARQLAAQRAAMARVPLADRGRGLLILAACTEGLCYAAAPPNGAAAPRHRLTFWIPASQDVCLDPPF